MMPTDILYHTYLGDDGRPRIEPSELLRKADRLSVLFFNEINRARPQVHSLLLRLMAERSLSAFDREHWFPFLQVFADRNMVEREETFELPAAARDRFLMEISITTPPDPEARRRLLFDPMFHDVDELVARVEEGSFDFRNVDAIARRLQSEIRTSESFQNYVLALWNGLQRPGSVGIVLGDVDADSLVRGGASPRGLAFLVRAARVRAWLEGRDYVIPDDVREVFIEVMAHRIFVDPIHAIQGDQLVRELCRGVFDAVPTP